MRTSFKYRFIVSFVLLELLFLGMIAILNFSFIENSTQKVKEDKINSLQTLSSKLLLTPVAIYDIATIDNILESLLKIDNVKASLVVDGKGLVLSSYMVNKRDSMYKMDIPLISDKTVLGHLYIWLDFKSDIEVVFDHESMIIQIILIELIISFMIAYLLGYRLSSNLEKLTNSVNSIGLKGEFVVPNIKTKDEIFVLSEAMKNMQKRIDLRTNELNELNQSLDKKVTEEVKKNQEKEKLLYEQSKLASMGEMIGNIAHQWRQPLSVISTAATAIKVQKDFDKLSDDFLDEMCDQIDDNSQYLSKTIDDFKNFIKGDTQQVEFCITSELKSLLKLVKSVIKNMDIEVIVSGDEDRLFVGNPNELKQCLMNLFNNSKDALESTDEENRYIFISQKIKNESLEIEFKDSAGGIPEDIINKIFEPYFTTKHQSQGTGLGLHMTYNLVVNGMNGNIKVLNETYSYNDKEFTGAKFLISIPMIKS